ncbi:MAG: hypothetical protein LBT14_01335, partial [Treponema sp.]|nr:hypothetical protein [Treponema sp.]
MRKFTVFAIVWSLALTAARAQDVRVFPQVAGNVYSASFSQDGKYVLSGGADGAVKVWDGETGALLKAFYGHGGEVRSTAFSPDGRRIVS